MAKTLTLTAGNTTLNLNDRTTGIIVSAVDLGAPAVREVVEDLPNQDGVDDQTQYLGQRVVQITGAVVAGPAGSRSKVRDLLVPFLMPSARPLLTVALDDDAEVRTCTLRAAQWTDPPASDSHLDFHIQWKGDPVMLGLVTNEQDSTPFSTTNGRSYPRTYPRIYPPAGAGGGHYAPSMVSVGGNYPTWPTFRIYGPVTNPTINVNSNLIVFAGLSINSGDYVEINTKARTVLLNGSAGASRYSYLDFSQTVWSPLQPGVNGVTITAPSASSPALLATFWQDAFI